MCLNSQSFDTAGTKLQRSCVQDLFANNPYFLNSFEHIKAAYMSNTS